MCRFGAAQLLARGLDSPSTSAASQAAENGKGKVSAGYMPQEGCRAWGVRRGEAKAYTLEDPDLRGQ